MVAFGKEQIRKRLLQETSVYSVWSFLAIASFFFTNELRFSVFFEKKRVDLERK